MRGTTQVSKQAVCESIVKIFRESFETLQSQVCFAEPLALSQFLSLP